MIVSENETATFFNATTEQTTDANLKNITIKIIVKFDSLMLYISLYFSCIHKLNHATDYQRHIFLSSFILIVRKLKNTAEGMFCRNPRLREAGLT